MFDSLVNIPRIKKHRRLTPKLAHKQDFQEHLGGSKNCIRK
uniref:Uncharacterized protein n=1 Tax=Rhizophora mucronata TaxID=61149 RepID=A0A2P2IZJ7_RHIMU